MTKYMGTKGDDVFVGATGQDNVFVGKGGDDLMTGADDNDVFRGGPGNDTMIGGLGENTASYRYSHFGVDANTATGVATGEGTDTLVSIQDLTGSHHDDTLTGDTGANVLDGGKGADVLSGADGADVLIGGKGADHLLGGAGADVLEGGRGRDVLTGGGGADQFVFTGLAEARGDHVTDLNKADSIDLSGIDANTHLDGDQAFTLVHGFDGAAGELTEHYSAKHDYTVISGDVNGDGHADFHILASGNHVGFDHFAL